MKSHADSEKPNYTTYSCTAEIVSPNEISEQSQTVLSNLDLQKTEGEVDENSPKLKSSEIGREILKEKLVKENVDRNNEVECTDFMLDEQILNRKISDFNSIDALEEFNKIKVTESNAQLYKTVKIDEGMLWHTV